MPRPEFSGATSSKQGSRNPIAAWREKRKKLKQNAEAEAARRITNDTARNELAIIDTLASIDFLHSPLPAAILNSKKDPRQPCGDLEYAARALQKSLKDNPQLISADIRKFDEKLLSIALLFKQSVENGDERAAYAAKGALVKGIGKIRSRIPSNQPELFRQFVEVNARYMENWITLINIAQEADRQKENNDQQRRLVEAGRESREKALTLTEERLKGDPEYLAAFKKVMENDSREDRAKWTALERNIHADIVNMGFENVTRSIKEQLLTQGETELAALIGQVETLYAKVSNTPIVSDPNLMNKYNEEIDELFDQFAETDQHIDEMLRKSEEITGRIEQLSQLSGEVHAKEAASETAQEMLTEIRNREKLRTGELRRREENSLHSIGLRSQEELDQIKAQIEEEERLTTQQMAEETVQEFLNETDAEVIYN